MKVVDIVNKFIFLINSVFLVGLLVSYAAQFLSPIYFWPISFLGLLFPILFIVNFIFLVYWCTQMKKQLWANLIILLIGVQYIDRFIGTKSVVENVEKNVKVLSYNVRLFNNYSWLPNIKSDTIYNYLNNEKSDIVCLQEFIDIDNGKNNLNYKYKIYNYGSKNGHLAILSNYNIINNENVIKVSDNKIENQCIFADIVIKKDTIRVYNIHLASNWFDNEDYLFINRSSNIPIKKGVFAIINKMKKSYKERAIQVKVIEKSMNKSPYPIIVCGDFNDTPISYTYNKIKSNLIDSFTISGSGIGNSYVKIPMLRIDYIMHDSNFESYNYQKQKKVFSDHYAISCEIKILNIGNKK